MAIESFGNGGIAITGERDVQLFGIIALHSALKMEVQCPGLKMGRKSAYSIVKKRWNLKGNKANVLAQFDKIVEEIKRKRDLSVMAETGENN